MVKKMALSAELKRHPSQKLPLINTSSSKLARPPQMVQRRASVDVFVQRKLNGGNEGIDRSTSKNTSKYSEWKYPTKLNENALRFF